MERYESEDADQRRLGRGLSIRELAETVRRSRRVSGRLRFDPTKPDGTPRKLLDVSRLQRARLAAAHSPARRYSRDLRLVPGASRAAIAADCVNAASAASKSADTS